MIRSLFLMNLMFWALPVSGQVGEPAAPFILGWDGNFAHGEVVTLKSADLSREKSGFLRVAIGNQPDLDQCTRQKPQAVHEWGQDSVAFEVDAEGFNPGDQVYVFLVGDDGTSSGGYAMTLGERIPDPEGPGQPGQPSLVDR